MNENCGTTDASCLSDVAQHRSPRTPSKQLSITNDLEKKKSFIEHPRPAAE
jgi:hypothetical protein